jgi:predicted small lipoprotein YifL
LAHTIRFLPRFFLLFILTATLLSCGKKGPPVAPGSTAPAPVADLRTWPREGTILLGWTAPTRNINGSQLKDLLGFRVFRQGRAIPDQPCPDCPLDFKPVAEIDVEFPRGARVEGGRVLWQDSAVQPGHEYTYFVRGYNFHQTPSPESNRVKVFWDVPPPAPEGVSMRSDNQALEITWRSPAPPAKEGPEPSGFNLYRRGEGELFGLFPINPQPVKETRFVDGGLANGRRYFYEVRAVRNVRGTLIEGPASAEAQGIPEKQVPPSPPSGVVAVFQANGAAVRWKENPEPDIAGYNLYRKEAGETSFRRINSELIKEWYFLDQTADTKKSYTYRLKAVDTSGKESEFSMDAEVSP